ncbi:fungal-specific transcription factor domain-containing protein [Xylariaceae sp. FL0016]|nr:fungal-specific transcription factor domain-containing protein [Xylariaceae sp. FL0016]
MASRCQRSILSCSRCRRRKMKCDRQVPSCTQCINAKTECTGISSAATGDVPRSIVLTLEAEIARLESELARDGQLDTLNATDILLQMPTSHMPERTLPDPGVGLSMPGLGGSAGPDPVEAENQDDMIRGSILSSGPLQKMISATLPCGSGATDLLSRVRMGLTPSSARVGERRRMSIVASKANNESGRLSAQVLRDVPVDIVQRLLRKYVSTINPDYPFIDSIALWGQFQQVSSVLGWDLPRPRSVEHSLTVQPDYDFLVVYLALAISITLGSSRGGHEARCTALSTSLFEEGIQHLYSLSTFPSDVAWLQVTLLVLLYATVLPRSANVWVLSGAAMRACLEIGLHREPPISLGLDENQLELRRRIFWSAYTMDRSICSALQRPLSTPDTAINTRLPSSPVDDAFLSNIHYQQLLSEMIHVHFQGEDIPGAMEWEDWLSSMEQRLREWFTSYPRNTSHHELIEFSLARGLMILHRPSPRNPVPHDRSLLIAFEAASSTARTQREHVLTGFFRRPWLSAHHTLEAAMIVLFCLRHGSHVLNEKFNASQIFEMTKLFTTNFLSIASQGWPEVSNYAGVYERLLGPLLESIFSGSQQLSERFGPSQDAELTKMLYPATAHLEKLRFGLRQPEQTSPFDYSFFNMEDDDVTNAMLNHVTPSDSRWGYMDPVLGPEMDMASFFTPQG